LKTTGFGLNIYGLGLGTRFFGLGFGFMFGFRFWVYVLGLVLGLGCQVMLRGSYTNPSVSSMSHNLSN